MLSYIYIVTVVPLIKYKLIKNENIIVNSKSGYSGAGRGVHKKYKKKIFIESLSVYGIAKHRHNSEIDQILKKFTKKKIKIDFTPHLIPMFRGILSSIYVDINKNVNYSKIVNSLINFYKKDPFVKIYKNEKLLSTNDVINTNNCYISINKSRNKKKLIILSVIDNLIKGGAGQAIQNLNIKYKFPIKSGLK